MKNFFVFLFMLVTFSVSGQAYKPFKFNISLGYAQPLLSGISGGALFALEPKYGVIDNLDLGLRLEGALIARGVKVNGSTSTGEVGYLGSYLLTANYLFGKQNARPFLGLGGGLYNITSSGIITLSDGQSWEEINLMGETKWGVMMRAGIKAGHFLVSIEYNAVPSSKTSFPNGTFKSRNDYLGVKLGFDIGGGRHKPE